ncbi:HTH-type transcriptional repressor ComR [Gimesia alba]|uniref:HTH-type transcriptional repressor ComR n=1 Tax=Gimesia alba TaxID=2527973 RepID=A0A517RDH0_9PLAN|nr:TetR/AcrR family transcriptional regulator [Gimesia alba]QDT41930.1 HTH-type transcriptional repressor ComR [Gimesia alba]
MTRGRPREFDEKKALEAALEVFWRKGYEGASCDELLSAMGLNAGSMYAAFGDKQALYDKAFELYCETVFSKGAAALDGPGTPLENVKAMIQGISDHMSSPECKGCFVGNTLIEFGAENKEIAEMARRVMKHFQTALEQKLKAAQESGELSENVAPTEMALFLVNMAQGLNVMARANAGKEAIQSITQTALAML